MREPTLGRSVMVNSGRFNGLATPGPGGHCRAAAKREHRKAGREFPAAGLGHSRQRYWGARSRNPLRALRLVPCRRRTCRHLPEDAICGGVQVADCQFLQSSLRWPAEVRQYLGTGGDRHHGHLCRILLYFERFAARTTHGMFDRGCGLLDAVDSTSGESNMLFCIFFIRWFYTRVSRTKVWYPSKSLSPGC